MKREHYLCVDCGGSALMFLYYCLVLATNVQNKNLINYSDSAIYYFDCVFHPYFCYMRICNFNKSCVICVQTLEFKSISQVTTAQNPIFMKVSRITSVIIKTVA